MAIGPHGKLGERALWRVVGQQATAAEHAQIHHLLVEEVTALEVHSKVWPVEQLAVKVRSPRGDFDFFFGGGIIRNCVSHYDYGSLQRGLRQLEHSIDK